MTDAALAGLGQTLLFWGLVALVPRLPWLLVRRLLVPLGAVRAAYWAAWLCWIKGRRDRAGFACFAASWALLHQPALEPLATWLERKLRKGTVLRGAGMLADGLLWFRRGELDKARAAARSLLGMDRQHAPALAVEVALDFLAADAAAAGDFAALRELGEPDRQSATRRLLTAIARRLLGDPSADPRRGRDPAGPDDLTLLFYYWRARITADRRLLWPLVERALAHPPTRSKPQRAESKPPAVTVPPPGTLAAAVLAQAGLYARSALFLSPEAIRGTAAAWESALAKPEVGAALRRRGVVLGIDGEAAKRALREQVIADLGALLKSARIALAGLLSGDGTPAVLLQAGARLRDALLSDLERACQALTARVDTTRALPLVDEWREWQAARLLYEEAKFFGGDELRRLAWPTYHRAICHHGVWMFNERKERVFGNTLFRHLLAEATELSDARRIELQKENVACGT